MVAAIRDMKITKVVEMKVLVDEIYGAWTFYLAVRSELNQIFNDSFSEWNHYAIQARSQRATAEENRKEEEGNTIPNTMRVSYDKRGEGQMVE